MKNGPYELVVAPENYPGTKYRGRYCYEHILVWWKASGSVPAKGFEIHHVNRNHRDNRISNLRLVTSAEHRRLHRVPRVVVACGWCESKIEVTQVRLAERIERSKSGKIFCDQTCGALHQHRGDKA